MDKKLPSDAGLPRPGTATVPSEMARATSAGWLGASLRGWRLGRRLTQQAVAERVGVSQSQLCRLEKGNGWTVETMEHVWRRLGRNPAEVYAVAYDKASRNADLPLFADFGGDS